jgi:Flp pilus assembly protein TadB
MSERTSNGCLKKHAKLAAGIILGVACVVLLIVSTAMGWMRDDVKASDVRRAEMERAQKDQEARLRAVETATAAAEARWHEVQRSLERIEKRLDSR